MYIFSFTYIVGEPTLPLKRGEEPGLGQFISTLMFQGLAES